MKMLNKSNLNVAEVSKKDTSGLFVDNNCTVATNGKILIRVTRPDVDSNEYPKIDGIEPQQTESFVMSSKQALDIAKTIPTKKTLSPILKNAVVAQNGILKIASTDLNNNNIANVEPLQTRYPDYKQVIPSSNNTKFEFCVNPALLEIICKQARMFQEQGDNQDYRMLIELGEPGQAAKISTRNIETRQEFLAVIMPMMPQTDEERESIETKTDC